MNRLMLEIYADPPGDAGGNGPADLPGLFIAPANGDAGADAPGGAVVLRLSGRGYVLEDPASAEPPRPGNLGEWLQAGGWRVRVTHAPLSGGNTQLSAGGAGMEEPSWAAPEIRITTYEGERPKHRRCTLPTAEGGQLVIGRGGPNTDLVVEDDHVSRRHMRFFVKGGQRMAEDLGSRWGTQLNGEALTDPKPLKHGDEIRLGKSLIQYFCFRDMLPPSGMTSVGKGGASVGPGVSVEAPDGLLAGGAPASQNGSAPADVKASAGPAAPVPQPIKPEVEKAPEPEPVVEKPVPPKPVAKPKAPAKNVVKKPYKRNYWGFDVIGAILLALIVLAGIGYVVYLVMFKK